MMEKRLSEMQKKNKDDKCIKRDIIQMVTRGTFSNSDCVDHEPKYCLAYKKSAGVVGVCFFDT